jgi:hypothetical protein
VLIFASGILWLDVKCYVYLFFTTRKIEISCKMYSIFFFTSCIFSTDVKALLISYICTSVFMLVNKLKQVNPSKRLTCKINK